MEENIISQLKKQKRNQTIKGALLIFVPIILIIVCYLYPINNFSAKDYAGALLLKTIIILVLGMVLFNGLFFTVEYNISNTDILKLDGIFKILSNDNETKIKAKALSKWLALMYPKLSKILETSTNDYYSIKIIKYYESQKRIDLDNAIVDDILKGIV